MCFLYYAAISTVKKREKEKGGNERNNVFAMLCSQYCKEKKETNETRSSLYCVASTVYWERVRGYLRPLLFGI